MSTPANTPQLDQERAEAIKKRLTDTGYLTSRPIIDYQKFDQLAASSPSSQQEQQSTPSHNSLEDIDYDTTQTTILRRPHLPPQQEEAEKYEQYLATMSTEKLEQIDSKYFGLPPKTSTTTTKTSGKDQKQLNLSRSILGGEEYHYKDENGDGGDDDSEHDNNESTTLLNKSKPHHKQQQPRTLATEHFPIHYKPQGTFPTTTFLRSLFLLLIGSIFLGGGLYRWYYNPIYITEEVQPQLAAMGIEQSTQPTELAPFFILAFLTLSPALYQLISIICAALNCCDMTYLDIANE